ncbi:LPS O-antigen chain length determinant protein WzzB [Vibrio cyclitrophicus]|uniref:LPS O-antigen chain length determinant protein WzzB n=1 Tax=Vibrio cyclitrophicus TaxID=47951 RepID=UPI0003184E02|nr:Wzz/FepE/Etk N-terminal domain-containing protein [Vibrio cyclitrophicus]ERM59202.1 regulator of length of O-antigen component of lipopolysaccharide chains [Vibrio cyclitrophicus FF75]OBS99072.1 chain-length determining protein [Vibrio cyclitrophicus]OEE48905.1 chain-length determining protein [Vibrio cyclitrophicus FF75]
MKQQIQSQPYSPQNPPTYIPNNEFYLKDLLKLLWEGKLIVIVVTALFTASSVGFALLAQEWWSSTAKIAEAQPQDMSAYQQEVRQFQPIFNIYQDDGTVLVSKELNKLVDSEVLFKRFMNTFNSSNNKRIFLENNQDFQAFKNALSVNGSSMDRDAERVLYAKWFKRITASIEDPQDRNSPYFINFQTTTKESSFDLLTAYVSFTESKVHQDAFNNLQAMVSGKRNELIQQKRILETQATNQLLVETERTKYAMGIARAAGVDTPIQTGNDNELFGIDLGSKGLEAKVQALESVKNLSVIEPRLQQITAKLDMLNNLKINRNADFQTFRFLENVEQPITRDKPKRALIVFIGAFLGGFFGVVIVLVRFALRKED